MYTNEDLNSAVKEGIFSESSVNAFRDYISKESYIQDADEENFKLVRGFNDIFVVIASLLLLISAGWISSSVSDVFSAVVVAGLSWGLSEFFVRKRKMSFPAIILLIVFVGSVFRIFYHPSIYIHTESEGTEFIIASALAGVATLFHWKRFSVPITIAIGMATLTTFVVAVVLQTFPNIKEYIAVPLFLMGFCIFILAMYWDMKDRKRITNDSDVAFWLHLLASPLMIHSIFLGLGVFNNNISSFALIMVLFAYVFLSSISLIIDRRALMVSSLLYVLYALNTLFSTYGFEGYGLAIGGVLIGGGLLFLTAFWTDARTKLLRYLPQTIQDKVPVS
jgi:hypothetical protein